MKDGAVTLAVGRPAGTAAMIHAAMKVPAPRPSP
jgi:hypothetical protein